MCFSFSSVWGILSRTGLDVWIPLVCFLSCRVFFPLHLWQIPLLDILVWVGTCFFFSHLEIKHSKPSLLANFGLRNVLLFPYSCLLWDLVFLTCIFQHTFLGLYLVFAVANVGWQPKCIWSQLKAKPMVTLGDIFLIRSSEVRRPTLNVGCVLGWQPR